MNDSVQRVSREAVIRSVSRRSHAWSALRAGATAIILIALLSVVSLRTSSIPLPVPRGTFPTSVNEWGEIAGYCVDSTLVAHGFVRSPGGAITVFDTPGTGLRQRQGTFVSDINKTGEIVGYLIDRNYVKHGFLRNPNGTMVVLNAPGAGAGLGPPIIGHPELGNGQGTVAVSLNDVGAVAGYFIDPKNVKHGFLRNTDGTYIRFDVPGSGGTEPSGVNDAEEVVGEYDDRPTIVNTPTSHSYIAGATHGFLRSANGTITTFDAPGAIGEATEGTHPQSVSASGAIAGSFDIPGKFAAWSASRGFIRNDRGQFTTFSLFASRTQPINIGSGRTIAACYLAAAPLASRFDGSGRKTFLWLPQAGLSPGEYRGALCQRLVLDATVVGSYTGGNLSNHGFVRDARGRFTTFDAPCEAEAVAIESVTPLIAGLTKSITIRGRHFGRLPPSTKSHGPYIVLDDFAVGRGCEEDVSIGPASEGTLRVARWTDTEIVVAGFTWPSKGLCPFHAGDRAGIGLWNPKTDAGPASFRFIIGSTSKDTAPPHIASITEVRPQAAQNIVIRGEDFGSNPTDNDSPYLMIEDETARWVSYRVGSEEIDGVMVNIGRWTDNEIEVTGFSGAYGRGRWRLNAGDRIKFEIWNPQTGMGPATLELLVSGPPNPRSRFSSGRRSSGMEPGNKRTGSGSQWPSGSWPITSSAQCTGAAVAGGPGGAIGAIQILSGTGTFAAISPDDKQVRVFLGQVLDGTVEMRVTNYGPSFAVAPLIWTPSWGDPASSWRLIQGWVGDGQSVYSATVQLTSPQAPGTYHIIFALQLEMNGANVASATNWARGEPAWGDGNDIADFNSKQIAEAQQYGCTTENWLSQTGYHPTFVPSDALTILVGRMNVSPTGHAR